MQHSMIWSWSLVPSHVPRFIASATSSPRRSRLAGRPWRSCQTNNQDHVCSIQPSIRRTRIRRLRSLRSLCNLHVRCALVRVRGCPFAPSPWNAPRRNRGNDKRPLDSRSPHGESASKGVEWLTGAMSFPRRSAGATASSSPRATSPAARWARPASSWRLRPRYDRVTR